MARVHCDDIIHNHKYPLCLRIFLLLHRMPAMDASLLHGIENLPWNIYATYKGKRVMLTMASRLGDVGIRNADELGEIHGYTNRVTIDELSDFSEFVVDPMNVPPGRDLSGLRKLLKNTT